MAVDDRQARSDRRHCFTGFEPSLPLARNVCFTRAMQEAVVIVLRDGQQLLMIQRAPGVPRPGMWSPPTGKVESGESQASAVEREAMEELGLRVRATVRLWQCETDDGRYRLHWWLAEPVSLPIMLRPNAEEIIDCRWILPQDFDQLSPTFARHGEFFLRAWPNWLRQCEADRFSMDGSG